MVQLGGGALPKDRGNMVFDDQHALSTREPTRIGVTVHDELRMDDDVKRHDSKVSIEEKRTDFLDSWTGTCWIYEYGVL